MKRMKMKELELASGVNRETIRFYIRKGLLPAPERHGRNVAFYDESFIERLHLIKALKDKRFLPLSVIKTILDGEQVPSQGEVKTLLDLEGKLFSIHRDEKSLTPRRLSDVAKQTGLAASELIAMDASGAINLETRDGDRWLDDTSIRIAQIWGKLRCEEGFSDELGFGPDELNLYVDFVQWIARQELALLTKGVSGKISIEKAARMTEAGIKSMGEIINLMRKATLLQYIAEGNLPARDEEDEEPDGPAAAGPLSGRRG